MATVDHSRLLRRAPFLAAAVIAAVTLSACGTAPGSAVEVAGVSTSISTVLDRTNEVVDANTGGSGDMDVDLRAQTARSQVAAVIRHALTQRTAQAQGITVTEADINAFVAQYDSYQASTGAGPLAGMLQVSGDVVRDSVYDLLVLDQMSQALPAEGVDVTNVTVNVDVVPADNWADAVAARVRYTEDPDAMTADAAAAREMNPGLPGGDESLLTAPHHAVFGIFSAAAGEILLIPNSDGSFLVTRITDRTEAPGKLTPTEVSNAYQAAGIAGQVAIGSLLLADAAAETPVTVNPRFGTFDPRTVQVVASR